MSYVYVRKKFYRLIVESGYDPKDYVNDMLEKDLIIKKKKLEELK